MSSEKHVNKMGSFLREVSNWRWDEFALAEHDKKYTSNEALIFALIRSCAMQKMDAIKMSLNRIDGKLKTPVKIETPKIFYLYPNASLPDAGKKSAPTDEPRTLGEAKAIMEGEPSREKPKPVAGEVIPAPELPQGPFEEEDPDNDLPSLSLRETLTKMSDYPRELPEQIVEYALMTEQALRDQGDMPDEIPRVKSVVAAHLLILAQKRNIDALGEVFDQIDGKLAETLQILGDDLYITSYLSEAPEGAYLNKDGILELEASEAQNMWAKKLAGEV